MRSMTGFGHAEETLDGRAVTVELKAVNHRFFEYNARLPRPLAFLDDRLKPYLARILARGKLDVFVAVAAAESGAQVQCDFALAAAYRAALADIAAACGVPDRTDAQAVARFPDVLTAHREAEDEETLWQAVRGVTDKALEMLLASRRREGEELKKDILARIEELRAGVAFIEARAPQTVREHMDKVAARLKELQVTADEGRLLTEAALLADRLAVDEETVRLTAHLDEFVRLTGLEEPVGRKLDFLLQEIGREINTVGSKSQDVALARTVVDMKAACEKIREQIQNVE